MFDLSIPIGDLTVDAAEDHVVITLHTVTMLPIQNPQTGGPLVFPSGQVHIKMAKEDVLAKAEAMIEAANQVKDPLKTPEQALAERGFSVAGSMDGVDRVVETQKAFRQGDERK